MAIEFKTATERKQNNDGVLIGIDESDSSPFRFNVNDIANVFNVKSYGAKGDNLTDDTVAIQTTINAVVDNGGGIVYFPNGIYIVGGALNATYNSQLYIPALSRLAGNYGQITFLGESEPNTEHFAPHVGTIPQSEKGAVIKSTLTTSSGNRPAVFATKNFSGETFNNNMITTRNIRLLTTPNSSSQTHMTGFNYCLAITCHFYHCVVGVVGSTADLIAPADDTVGIFMPYLNSNTNMTMMNNLVAGYKHGFVYGENITVIQNDAFACYYGHTMLRNGWPNHYSMITAQWCTYGINTVITDLTFDGFIDTGSSTAKAIITVFRIEATQDADWFDTVYFINDPDNYLIGECGWYCVHLDLGVGYPLTMVVDGGANFLQRNISPNQKASAWTISGSRGGNVALTDLLASMEVRGLIIDNTTA